MKKEIIRQDKYAKKNNCTRVAIAEVAPNDWVLFWGGGFAVEEVKGDRVRVNDIGWGHITWTIEEMINCKMKVYRGHPMGNA